MRRQAGFFKKRASARSEAKKRTTGEGPLCRAREEKLHFKRVFFVSVLQDFVFLLTFSIFSSLEKVTSSGERMKIKSGMNYGRTKNGSKKKCEGKYSAILSMLANPRTTTY